MGMTRRFAIGVLLVTAMTACASDDGPGGSGTGSPTPSNGTDATVYFLVSSGDRFFLSPEVRRVVEGDDPARARLEEMLRGVPADPDLFSAWPGDAQIESVTIEGGIATIDWTADVLEAEVGSEVASLAIQQAAWTLAELDGIERVAFQVEGRSAGTASNGRAIEDWWGHVGLAEQPFSPTDDVLAPITITSPEEGAEASGAVRVAGEASVFEANVTIRLRDEGGTVLEQTFATASVGAPERGTWSLMLPLPAEPGTYTVEAVEVSAEDGSDFFVATRSIRVTG